MASRFPAHRPLLESPQGSSSFRKREPHSKKLGPSAASGRTDEDDDRGAAGCVWIEGGRVS